MAGLFGGGGAVNETSPVISSLRLQTSCYGKPVPWVFGQARVSPNIIQYEDFTPIAHESQRTSGGKGGGGAPTSIEYTYTVALVMALCSGPVNSVTRVWKDKDITSVTGLNLDLYTGTNTQTSHPYFVGSHPDRALPYRGFCYVASGAYDLGGNASLDNHSYEVQSNTSISASITDANPKDVITAILTDKEQGLGLPASSIGDLTPFSNFCLANGIWVSPAYTDQSAAFEKIKNLLQIGFADCVYSEGVFKVIPYSDTSASNSLATYTPVIAPAYTLTDDDFIGAAESVIIRRKSMAETFNHFQVKYSDRTNDYNENVAEAKDQADIEQYGLRTSDPIDFPEICDKNTAQKVADFLLHRSLNVRNEYEFKLPWRYVLLEAMDCVLLACPRLGLNNTPVLITEITEDEEGLLTVIAEDYPLGTNKPSSKVPPTTDGYTPNFNIEPGNSTVPAIFEAPFQLTKNDPQVWLATAGAENWGGCDVWVSTDNASYQKVGRMNNRSRYGSISSAISAGATIDTLNVLSVDLSTAKGYLTSGTQQNAQDLTTLCYVGGEYLAYANANLTGVNTYNLSYLVRGAYGTTNEAHAIGSTFVRLDDNLFKFSYPAAWLGKTIWVKLVSFNQYGGATQDVSSVPAYSYNIVGAPLGAVQNVRMATSWASGKNAVIAWDILGGADSYDVQVLAGTPAAIVRTVTALNANTFTYTPQDMIADGGAWRSIAIKVRGRSVTGKVGQWSQILATNPQIGALTGITVDAGIKTIFFNCTVPTEEDFDGIIVWASTDPSCPTVDANKIYDGPNTFVTINKLTNGDALVGGTAYYIKACAYDTFGKDSLTISTSVSVTPVKNAPDANTITNQMLQAGIVQTANFAQGIQPVGVVSALPSPTGYTGPTVVTLTTDGKIYRLVGGAWTTAVPTTDLSGTVSSGQIASGAITSTQITDNAITTGKLAAGAITSDKIAANSITAGKLATDAVTAGTIAAGAVNAREIAANSITADKLVIGDFTNIIPNCNFDDNLAGWYKDSSNFSSTVTQYKDVNGVGVTLYKPSPTDWLDLRVIDVWNVPTATVTAGDIYAVSCKIKKNQTSENQWIGIDSVYFYTNGSTTRQGFASTNLSDTTLATQVVIPANVIGISFLLFWAGASSGAGVVTATITNIRAQKMQQGQLIVDGTITGQKIVASAITGDKIAANSITSEKIVANSITGDKIQAGSVNANVLSSGIGGGNLVPNSAFTAVYTDGVGRVIPDGIAHFLQNTSTGVPYTDPVDFGVNLSGDDLRPYNVNVLAARQVGTQRDGYWSDWYTEKMPAVAGQFYEASAYLSAHRCYGSLAIVFHDVAGNRTGTYWSPSTSANVDGKWGGTALTGYFRAFVIAQAPANTVWMELCFQKTGTATNLDSGAWDSYLFTCLPYAAPALSQNQNAPSPWSPSGLGSLISGANIKTNTIAADRMAVGQLSAISANMGSITAGSMNINNRFIVDGNGTTTIQSATGGQRLLLTNDYLKVFDGNGTARVHIGNLSA